MSENKNAATTPTTNIWNQDTEKRIRNYRNNAAKRASGHFKKHQELMKHRKNGMVVGGVCTALTTLLTTLNSMLHPEDHILIPIIIALVAAVGSFSQIIMQVQKIESTNIEHMAATKAYAKLVRNMDRQLQLQIEHRLEQGTYFNYVGDEFDKIMSESPDLSDMEYIELVVEDEVPQTAVLGISDKKLSSPQPPVLIHQQSRQPLPPEKFAQMEYELARFRRLTGSEAPLTCPSQRSDHERGNEANVCVGPGS
jgi:hypothetical protein